MSTTTDSLEHDRTKLLARLNGQVDRSTCRPRSFLELAGIEARLGHTDDAITALRDAIASGLDVAYAKEIRTSAHFDSLRNVHAFQVLLASFEGVETVLVNENFIYARGEREKCDETLLCSICTDPLVEPMIHSQCGAQYCDACIAICTICPQCHSETECMMYKLTMRTILNKLDGLKIHCPRCQRVMERNSLKGHMANECPRLCTACRTKIPPKEMRMHEQQCTAVVISCSSSTVGCSWRGMRRELATHARKCYYAKNHDMLLKFAALEASNRDLHQRVVELESVAARFAAKDDVENIVQ